MAVPSLTPLPAPPLPSDAEAIFDAKAGASLTAQDNMVDEINIALGWMNGVLIDTNDVAANAAAAAQSAVEAEAARDDAADSLASSQVVAAAVQASAGMPSFTGHDVFDVLQINAAKTGVQWGKVGQSVGDVLFSFVDPGALYKLADNSIYLKSAYPLASAALGVIDNKNFAGSFTSLTSVFGTAPIKGITTGLGGVMIAVADGASGTTSYVAAKSTDGGVTWTPYTTGPLGSSTRALQSIASDGAGVWVIGVGGNESTVIRSTDNGVTWANVTSVGGGNINAIATDRAGVWVVGGTSGARSTDNGATWSSQAGLPVMTLGGGIATDSSGNWLAGGNGGAVARSENNGATWATKASGANTQVNAVVTDKKGRWIVCCASLLIISKDAGMTFKATGATAGGGNLTGNCMCVDANGIWVVGATGGILSRSFDGENWLTSTNSFGSAVYALGTDNAGSFVAGSANGLMSRSAPTYFYDSTTQFRMPKIAAQGGALPYIKLKAA